MLSSGYETLEDLTKLSEHKLKVMHAEYFNLRRDLGIIVASFMLIQCVVAAKKPTKYRHIRKGIDNKKRNMLFCHKKTLVHPLLEDCSVLVSAFQERHSGLLKGQRMEQLLYKEVVEIFVVI